MHYAPECEVPRPDDLPIKLIRQADSIQFNSIQ